MYNTEGITIWTNAFIEEKNIFFKKYTCGVKKKGLTNVFQQLKIYIYCSMRKKYRKGVQKL